MTRYRVHARTRAHRMMGFTLLEWVLAMPLGLLIVMAAIAIYLAGLRLWRAQAERYDVNERAMFALTQLSRAVAMAGYRNWDPMEGRITAPDKAVRRWPPLRASAECAASVETCARRGWQGSDLMEVQFHGAGYPIGGNGAVQNCSGLSVKALGSPDDRHLSIFYVAKGEDGVPSLFCRYGDYVGPSYLRQAQVLVTGVEAMYLRLGFRVGGNGPLRWSAPLKRLRGTPPRPPAGEGGWDNVAAVAISLVMRGAPRRGAKPTTSRVVEVFDKATGGREYKRLMNAGDVHLHVFTLLAYRRNDGGIGEEAKWLASSL
ncbi:hypothetical protein FP568_17325 [Pandoraea pnomenusa]|nr:hypothetical protein FP568_17325 [Pandoraea pnomenusa]